MSSVTKRLKTEPLTCKMCKGYTIGKPVYEYEFSSLDEEPRRKIKICQKCAKREHGSRNKKQLPEL